MLFTGLGQSVLGENMHILLDSHALSGLSESCGQINGIIYPEKCDNELCLFNISFYKIYNRR